MNVFLLLYLCSTPARTDCQVFPVQRWMGPDSYQRCGDTARQLTADLTEKNRKRNYFVCDIQSAGDLDAAQQLQPLPPHRPFRL